MFCTACGTENLPGSHFCANCGAALPAGASGTDVTSAISSTGPVPDVDTEFSAEAHQGAVDALTPGSALLVVKRGPNAGSRFLLDQDVTSAGRHPDSDIFLDDVTVSRRHAVLTHSGWSASMRANPKARHHSTKPSGVAASISAVVSSSSCSTEKPAPVRSARKVSAAA